MISRGSPPPRIGYDHPLSRRAAERGVSHQTLEKEILADFLVTKPWPNEFDPSGFSIPPFPVSSWLKDGKRAGFGGSDFEVIHTPGEAPDHVCLLDRTNHLLFCGDILLHGPVWTHLEGGNLEDLARSYRRLMNYFDEFDHLMPGHNQPYLEKDLLPETQTPALSTRHFDTIRMRWESQLSCRISGTLSYAGRLLRTSSTPSAVGRANGASQSVDREQPRTGICEWRDPTDLNGPILSPRPLASMNLRQSALLY